MADRGACHNVSCSVASGSRNYVRVNFSAAGSCRYLTLDATRRLLSSRGSLFSWTVVPAGFNCCGCHGACRLGGSGGSCSNGQCRSRSGSIGACRRCARPAARMPAPVCAHETRQRCTAVQGGTAQACMAVQGGTGRYCHRIHCTSTRLQCVRARPRLLCGAEGLRPPPLAVVLPPSQRNAMMDGC